MALPARILVRLRHGSRDRRGAVLVLIALSLMTILGFVGLVIDGGYLYLVRQKAQAACDAAALAAAYNIANGQSTQTAQASAASQVNNMRGVTSSIALSPFNSGLNAFAGYGGNNTRVQCITTVIARPFFLGLLGFGSFTVQTRAVGQSSNSVSTGGYNPFTLGMFGRTRITISGGIQVDGFDSTQNTYNWYVSQGLNRLGQMGSNGDINFMWSGSTISGNMDVMGSINLSGGVHLRNGNLSAMQNIQSVSSGGMNVNLYAGNLISFPNNGAILYGSVHAGNRIDFGQPLYGNAFANNGVNLFGGATHYANVESGRNLDVTATLVGTADVNGTVNIAYGGSQGTIHASGNTFIAGDYAGNVRTTGIFDTAYGRVTGGTVTVKGGAASYATANAISRGSTVVVNPSLTAPAITPPTAPVVTTVSLPAINTTGLSAASNPVITYTGNNVLSTVNNPPDFNITTDGGSSATLPSGTYYFNSFTVSNKVVISGNAVIYTRLLNVTNSGGSEINGGNAYFYVYGNETVNLSAGSNGMKAAVYAPNSAVTVNGSSEFTGAVVSNTIDIIAGARFRLDRGLASPGTQGSPGAAVYRLTE